MTAKTVDSATMIEFLSDKVVKWWLPDDVVMVAELPHTATGKLLKAQLRDEYQGYVLPTV